MPTKRDDPYLNFNFAVDLGAGGAAGFAEVELGGARVNVIEYREGGDRTNATRKLPGRVHYGNVVLRRGITGDASLWQWFEQVRDGTPAKRNVTVTLLDEARQPVVRWLLRNAFPVKWDPPDLNAKGNEVAFETLELAIEELELETG